MDSWKSRGGKSQVGEEKKWEDQRGERVRRKKLQVREKVGKSRFTVFFQWFGAPEGRKVTSLKPRVRSHAGPDKRWKIARRCGAKQMSKWKCATAHQVQTTFGSWDVEKVHAVVGAKHISKWKRTKHTWGSDQFWKLRCRKSARRSGLKQVSKSKCAKHISILGPLLQKLRCRKRARCFGAQHISIVTTTKNWPVWSIFWHSDVVFRGRRTGMWALTQNGAKAWGFCCTFNHNYNCTTRHYTTPLHYTALHYTPLQYTRPHYATLTLHYRTLHYSTLH